MLSTSPTIRFSTSIPSVWRLTCTLFEIVLLSIKSVYSLYRQYPSMLISSPRASRPLSSRSFGSSLNICDAATQTAGSDSLYYILYLWCCPSDCRGVIACIIFCTCATHGSIYSFSSLLYTCTQLQYVITPSNYVYNTEIYTNALSLKTLGWLIQHQTNTQISAGLLTTQTMAVGRAHQW